MCVIKIFLRKHMKRLMNDISNLDTAGVPDGCCV